MPKVHIVGNWKMNQNLESVRSFAKAFEGKGPFNCETWIAPQAIHISGLIENAGPIKVGSQTVSEHEKGAFTGELSPTSLKDIGATFTLVGHSERRQYYGEGNEVLNEKVKSALSHGLKVIYCVGETLEQRESGQMETILKEQVSDGLRGITSKDSLLIAYEPVWAIGTGVVATTQQAQQAHEYIRGLLSELGLESKDISILYGGSVKPNNIDGLLECPDIDGALVGGASLDPESFLALCQSGDKH